MDLILTSERKHRIDYTVQVYAGFRSRKIQLKLKSF